MTAATVIVAVLAVLGFPQGAGAQVPTPPPNGNCDGAAVVTKLSVVEDRAAANMLAEAAAILGLGERCLVDAGDPGAGRVPSGSRSELAGASRVFVVGGPAALPHSWLTSRLGVNEYERIAGGNRWDTQASVASAIVGLARGEPVVEYSGQPASSPTLPPNTGCSNAVVVKLNVVEDRAAANMLAETFNRLSSDGKDRCLVDVGDPGANVAPTRSAIDDYDYANSQYVIGGPAAIPDGWLDSHFSDRGYSRLAGHDRWRTQAAVVDVIIDAAVERASSANDSLQIAESETLSVTAQRDYSDTTIVVHYCGSEPAWTQSRLDAEVNRLYRSVGREFYSQQFGQSGFRISFRSGERLTPSSMPTGADASIAFLHQTFAEGRSNSGSTPCELELQSLRSDHEVPASPLSGDEIDLFLVDVSTDPYHFVNDDGRPRRNSTSAWAWRPRGAVFVATPGHYRSSVAGEDYLTVVAHEIGHSAYNLSHPWPKKTQEIDGRSVDIGCHDDDGRLGLDELTSIMSYTWPNPPCNRLPIDQGHVSCIDRLRSYLMWLAPGVCGESLPAMVPSAPIGVQVISADRELNVRWEPPEDDGRSPITGYSVLHRRRNSVSTWSQGLMTVPHERSKTIAGLQNGVTYEVKVVAHNAAGTSEDSTTKTGTPSTADVATVTLSVGSSAQGQPTTSPPDGECSARCRWLDVEVDGITALGSGPYNVVCAHRGISGATFNYRAGWFKWKSVTSFPNSDTCFFGFPGAEVYVIVGAEWVGGRWEGGIRSNTVQWPNCQLEPQRCGDAGGSQASVRISWGDDARNQVSARTGRRLCPEGEDCRNLEYEIRGLGEGPWNLTCGWADESVTTFLWSGNPKTACLYWGESDAQIWVAVNGVRSNELSNVSRPRSTTASPTRTPTPQVEAGDGVISVRLGVSAGFDIQYRQVGGPWRTWNATDYVNVAGDGIWTTIGDLTNGVAYLVRIRSRDPASAQTWSHSARATPRGSATSNMPQLTVTRGNIKVDGRTCPTAATGCRWVVGSGTNWPAGEQFWIKCGDFVDTSRNRPVTYRARHVDSNGNLSWGESICYSAGSHSVDVWTESGVRRTVHIQ